MWPLPLRRAVVLACAALAAASAQAGLFDDEEARRAILELRTRITANDESAKSRHAELAQANALLLEQVQQLRRSLLDLNSQLEAVRADNAKLRGTQEQIVRDQAVINQQAQTQAALNLQTGKDIADLQRQIKEASRGIEDRIKRMEPVTVTVDGREFQVDPDEKRAYDNALSVLRTGDFDKGAATLNAFVKRYPSSGYLDSARFWLGNALYGKKDYKEAIGVFRAMLGSAPEHPRAAEALLGVANCQVEMKDVKSARKTIDELLKAYPNSEAAVAGKERLGTLKG
jgi:tol-pal system protein YbgF